MKNLQCFAPLLGVVLLVSNVCLAEEEGKRGYNIHGLEISGQSSNSEVQVGGPLFGAFVQSRQDKVGVGYGHSSLSVEGRRIVELQAGAGAQAGTYTIGSGGAIFGVAPATSESSGSIVSGSANVRLGLGGKIVSAGDSKDGCAVFAMGYASGQVEVGQDRGNSARQFGRANGSVGPELGIICPNGTGNVVRLSAYGGLGMLASGALTGSEFTSFLDLNTYGSALMTEVGGLRASAWIADRVLLGLTSESQKLVVNSDNWAPLVKTTQTVSVKGFLRRAAEGGPQVYIGADISRGQVVDGDSTSAFQKYVFNRDAGNSWYNSSSSEAKLNVGVAAW